LRTDPVTVERGLGDAEGDADGDGDDDGDDVAFDALFADVADGVPDADADAFADAAASAAMFTGAGDARPTTAAAVPAASATYDVPTAVANSAGCRRVRGLRAASGAAGAVPATSGTWPIVFCSGGSACGPSGGSNEESPTPPLPER
jgi:hypothetical protein